MEKLVEIARSFFYKVNSGDYQPKDFFCFQKAECEESKAEKMSEALHEFCKKEVMKSVNKYLREQESPKGEPTLIEKPIERDQFVREQLPEIQEKNLPFQI